MTTLSTIPFVAAGAALLIAVTALLRRRRSPAAWFLFAGMTALAADSLFSGLSFRASGVDDVTRWLTFSLVAKSCLPGPWLGFSLTYSRGERQRILGRWLGALIVATLAPLGLTFAFQGELLQVAWVPSGSASVLLHFGVFGTALNVFLLVALVLILMNLEQTFRSSVGTMRWRLKLVILGLAVIFGAHIYVRTQAVLYSLVDPSLRGLESSALLVGSLLLIVAYARTGLADADVYPSRAVVRSSVTVLIVGGYLFVVGVLAQVARRFGGAESFQFQALVVLAGTAGLALLLLSDRVRQRIQEFVGRHFRMAQHDSAKVWSELSMRITAVQDRRTLCSTAARLIAETFDVLAVTVLLFDDHGGRLEVAASTAPQVGADAVSANLPESMSGAALFLKDAHGPFNLEELRTPWAEVVRSWCPTTFPNGGQRWCVPLRTGDELTGAVVLADRVNGAPYTTEEREIIQCIAGQVTSGLRALRLADEVARAGELEAFRTLSSFFVHDLKNAAASLTLMLKNLPVHFDDPSFREDALRGIGNTVRRIDDMIARLSALRERPELRRAEVDLNRLVEETLGFIGPLPGVAVTTVLQPLPPISGDEEYLRSVVTNLVLNARDATVGLADAGTIEVRSVASDGRVLLSVADNGCGMAPTFMRDVLFRPFQSTKSKGLGIGMFQARMIVELHGGRIQVESEVGVGTTVRVSLPAEVA